MFDAATRLDGLHAEGVAARFQPLDVRGLGQRTEPVPPVFFIRGQEYIGVGGLFLLFDAQAAVERPGLAEQVGRMVGRFDPRAGVGTDAGADAEPMGGAFAHRDEDGRGSAVLVGGGVLPIDRYAHRGEVGGCLQRALQFAESRFTVAVARLCGAVVAGDQFGRMAVQSIDAQGAEAVTRAGVVMRAQAGLAGFAVDPRLAVDQLCVGVVSGEKFTEDLLLGGAPVLLAERLAGGQAPAGLQLAFDRFCDRAVDRQVDVGDAGTRAGVDIDAQRFAFFARFDRGREIPLGRQYFFEHRLQATR